MKANEIKKMEVGAKEARGKLSALLKQVEGGGEVVLLRRGKQVARLVPFSKAERNLPSLAKFRASLRIKGRPVSKTVIFNRTEERY